MKNERLLLIDGFNIIIAQNSVANILDHNAQPVGTYLTVIQQIRNFTDLFKPTRIVFALDGPEAGQRRRLIHPGYKNKRRITARKSKAFLYNGEDKKDRDEYEVDGAYEKQLKQIYEYLKHLPVALTIVPYCEADDIIAYLALRNQENFSVIICSTDKDYLQLINQNISVYNWKKKVLYDENKFLEEHKIKPKNYIYKKLLLGDDSDKIDNIKSIGKKTFADLFEAELAANDTLADLTAFINYLKAIDKDSLVKKYHKFIDLLITEETKKTLVKNFRLMKLEEVNLQQHHIALLKRQIDEQNEKRFSKISAKITALNDNFNKLYGSYSNSFNIDKFLQPFLFVASKTDLTI